MAYELYNESRYYTRAFIVSWSELGDQFRINTAMTKFCFENGWARAEIYIDKFNHKIAFKKADDSSASAVKLARANAGQCSMSAAILLREIRRWGYIRGRWVASYNKSLDMIEIDLKNGELKGSLKHRELMAALANNEV